MCDCCSVSVKPSLQKYFLRSTARIVGRLSHSALSMLATMRSRALARRSISSFASPPAAPARPALGASATMRSTGKISFKSAKGEYEARRSAMSRCVMRKTKQSVTAALQTSMPGCRWSCSALVAGALAAAPRRCWCGGGGGGLADAFATPLARAPTLSRGARRSRRRTLSGTRLHPASLLARRGGGSSTSAAAALVRVLLRPSAPRPRRDAAGAAAAIAAARNSSSDCHSSGAA